MLELVNYVIQVEACRLCFTSAKLLMLVLFLLSQGTFDSKKEKARKREQEKL